MGWSSGSEVMNSLIQTLMENVKDEKVREKIYHSMIEALEDQDWDCQGDCLDIDPAYDRTIRGMNPEWFDEDY